MGRAERIYALHGPLGDSTADIRELRDNGTPLHGDLSGGATRFSTFEGGGAIGGGSKNFGAFLSINGSSSDRFLDPVNPDNLHNHGATTRGFLRLDYASDSFKDQVRFTTLAGQTNRDVPNTYTQEAAGQDQQVKSHDQNFNLGWTHVLSNRASFDINASARHSRFELLPSANDTPVLAKSDRTLDNYSVAPSLTAVLGAHELKVGGVFKSFPVNGDQDQFLNTGVVFPLSFTEGKHNGWDARLDLAQTHGVRGFVSLGHTRAVYIPPPSGGLFLDAASLDSITGGPFLIDHDQKLQAQAQVQVDFGKTGVWVGANVRYDSGLVTGASPADLASDPDNAFAAPFVVVHSGADLDPNRIKARTIGNFSVGFDRVGHGLPARSRPTC